MNNIDLSNSIQSSEYNHKVQYQLYSWAQEKSQKHETAMRFSGLGLGIASGLALTICKIAQFIEPIIKGLINVAGSPFHNKCDVKKGLKQLLISFPVQALLAATVPIHLILLIPTNTFSMLVNPQWFSGRLLKIENEQTKKPGEKTAEDSIYEILTGKDIQSM